MVRTLIYTLCITLIPLFVLASQKPLTGEGLRQLLSGSENEHAVHNKELKSNRLHELLKPTPEDEVEKPVTETTPESPNPPEQHLELPRAIDDKDEGGRGKQYNFFKEPVKPEHTQAQDIIKDQGVTVDADQPDQRPKNKDRKKSTPKPPPRANDEDRYVPPSWQYNAGKKASPIHSAQAEIKKGPFFGIRLGTEFRAKLIRTTTNIEPTLAEFIVVDEVFGDFKMMQKSTKIYAEKKVSNSSNRIYFNTVKGITPDGEEFEMKGTITDVSTHKLAGLAGAITTDNELINRSASSGAFAAGGEFIKQVASDNVLGSAVGAAADTALSEKEEETKAKYGDASFVIFVNPQDAFIRVDETF